MLTTYTRRQNAGHRLGIMLAILLFTSTYFPASAFSAEPAEQIAGSLKLVPANATFYSSSLRNRETLEIITKSKAWHKFLALPVVQKAWDSLQNEGEFGEALDQVKEFFSEPANQELLAMLGDMCGDEIFMYGDENWANLLATVMQIQTAMNYGPMFGLLSGQADTDLAQKRAVLDTLDEQRDKLRVPQFVIGFKVTDKKRAETQLKRLADLANAGAAMAPALKGRVQNQSIAGVNYLVLKLDGSLIPWDDLPIDDLEEEQGQYDKLLEKLKSMKVVVGIGLREDYVLVSVGESLDHLAKFGQGPKLVEKPEFKQLVPYIKQRVNGISFSSQELRSVLKERGNGQFVYLKEKLSKLLEKSELPDDMKNRMRKDLEAVSKDLISSESTMGAELMVTFHTDKGIEGYTYDWSKYALKDGSQPLSLLEHVGGSPLAFSVMRHKPTTAGYDTLVKLVKLGHGYFEDLALPLMGQDEKDHFEKLMKSFGPLMSRIDQTTRTKLFPALADGQFAFVLDGRISSKRWIKANPDSQQALPMLEPALVWGVSDAELLKKSVIEYQEAVNDFCGTLNLEETPLALFRIPDAETKELPNGNIYSYNYFELMGLDKLITPNAGLSKTVAVLSISPKQSERILTTTPLEVPGLLKDAKQPLGGATYINWAGIVDTVTPWIELGIRKLADEPTFLDLFGLLADEGIRPNLKPVQDDPPEVKAVLEQVRTGLELLKVLQSYSSRTYLENGTWVTHHELLIQDIP